MKDFILCTLIGSLIYYFVIFPLNKWNCERVGMTADIFVYGCVIKGD